MLMAICRMGGHEMSDLAKLPELLTASEVASYLRVSRRWVHEWTKNGILPFCRVGKGKGVLRFRREDVQAYLNSTRTPAA